MSQRRTLKSRGVLTSETVVRRYDLGVVAVTIGEELHPLVPKPHQEQGAPFSHAIQGLMSQQSLCQALPLGKGQAMPAQQSLETLNDKTKAPGNGRRHEAVVTWRKGES